MEKRFAGSEFEFLRAFHREHCFGLRLLDFHMPERARVVVMMDTDVLFFHRPVDLLTRCIEAQEGPALTSFRDDFDWLSVMGTKEHIKAVFKIKIEHEFNAGMVVMPRFGDTQFRFFERMLRSYEPEWRKSYFAEQALWMLAAGEYGWRALPGSYQIGHESNPSDAVAIHYVSNRAVRPRFFTEGLPRLIHTLRC